MHPLLVFLLFFVLCFSYGDLTPVVAQSQQGYRLDNDRVIIDSVYHWSNWQLPTHAIEITSRGWVHPHSFRDRYNLLDDLITFTRTLSSPQLRERETTILNLDSTETLDVQGEVLQNQKGGVQYTYILHPGISRVGSNPEAAANILDGNPYTFWEPDSEDPIYNWWVEVDLGRVVPVDELILHFVDQELGDPFRQFRVLVAANQEPIAQRGDSLNFESVGGTQSPNYAQRYFRFPLAQVRADPNWKGKLVETIRIVATDTQGSKGRPIVETEWFSLPPEDRGDIVFFARDFEGIEEPVDRIIYLSLPPERQGRREYYAREHPRLADIEVWGWGDNISLGIVAGGGSVELTGSPGDVAAAFDGDINTWFWQLIDRARRDVGRLIVDMGATFWLDTMRLSEHLIWGYVVRASEGVRDLNNHLRWWRLSPPTRENISQYRYQHVQDVYDPLQKVRWLEMTHKADNPQGILQVNLRELQLFARGYPAEVVLTSDMIELPAARYFGRITWEGRIPPNTRLDIRTRTGDVRNKKIRYFDRLGSEITYAAWKNLIGSWKGPTDTTWVPGSGWSFWSQPYRFPGERVISPGLRKFLQIQIKMGTEDPDVAPAIHSIAIELLKPVVARLLAEIDPSQALASGQVDTFKVFIQPYFIEQPVISHSAGFDEILLDMSAGGAMELLELTIDRQNGRSSQTFHPSQTPGLFTDTHDNPLQVLRNRADSIWVRLPIPEAALPEAERVYHRIGFEGEQVPIDQDGSILSALAWGMLDKAEKGDIRYFRQLHDADTRNQYVQVDQLTWEALEEEEKGPVRYFRILQGDGAQVPFDAEGDSLDAASYERLDRDAQGQEIVPGALISLCFRAPVFRYGTTLRVAVRHARNGTDPDAPWQNAEPGDAAPGVGSNTLSLSIPHIDQFLDALTVYPNPFTPNRDGINDQTQIRFSVFQISKPQKVRVRIYTLDGRFVWMTSRMVHAGSQAITWDGVDSLNRTVPPGLYLCQVHLDVDESQEETICSRILSVAY